jgi:fatty acid desaturase
MNLMNESSDVYTGRLYSLKPETFQALMKKSMWILPACLAFDWLIIFGLIRLFFYWDNWILYPIVALLIAGRQGSLLNVTHELSHSNWQASEALSTFVGRWFCSSPIGADYDGYKTGHLQHHQFTNQEKDPESDREKYTTVTFKDKKLFRLFLKDLLGLSAIKVFSQYVKGGGKAAETKGNSLKKMAVKIAQLAVPNLIILFWFFKGQVGHYLILWIVPAMCVHMFLMRIRGIAEHGLGVQLKVPDLMAKKGLGTKYVRTMELSKNGVIGWIERILIGSIGVNYHHEHHLYPKIPFHNLKKFNHLIRSQVIAYNPQVYTRSYWETVLKPPTP